MTKVFCSECDFIRSGSPYCNCIHSSNIKIIPNEDDWYQSGSIYQPRKEFIRSPVILNENNDCKNFEPKRRVEKPIETPKKKWWKK